MGGPSREVSEEGTAGAKSRPSRMYHNGIRILLNRNYVGNSRYKDPAQEPSEGLEDPQFSPIVMGALMLWQRWVPLDLPSW